VLFAQVDWRGEGFGVAAEAGAVSAETFEDEFFAPSEYIYTETATVDDNEKLETVEVPVPEPQFAEIEKTAEPAKPQKIREPREFFGSGAFSMGVRLGLGMSGLHGHKALIDPGQEDLAIVMRPVISTSAGLAMAIRVVDGSENFTLAFEPQYSLYRAHGEFVMEEPGADYRNLYVAGVFLHTVELPILARFNLNSVYMEAGIQPGANLYAQIYEGGRLRKPEFNKFACGIAAGMGAKRSDMLLGIRGYYSFIQYDKKLNGYPWSIQVSLTKNFLN
jgi:hypothetical protein